MAEYEESSRYPYTYAADKIRDAGGRNEDCSTKISRSDASQILKVIATALGHDNHEILAKAIADKYKDELQ